MSQSKERKKQWARENKEKVNEASKRSYRKYRAERMRTRRERAFKESYGVTYEWYEEALHRQLGVCAICLQPPTGKRHFASLHVDHNHATGKVRELLCGKCNAMLGLAKDSQTILTRAIQYIEKHSGATGCTSS